MIIIRFLGGLGNQLFIYAFGRALQLHYNLDVSFDTYSGFKNDPYKRKFELDNFNTVIKTATLFNSLYFPISKRSYFLTKILFPNSVYIEENENFSTEQIKAQLNNYSKIYLQGYFQKQEYFESIKDELRTEITFKKELSETAKYYLGQINNCNSVAVHIRRKERKDSFRLEFYLSEIESMRKKNDNPKFFIFSDDINWCKNILPANNKFVFVTETKNQIEDFWLIKNCKHFIIGNSTFSWWAMFLGTEKHS